MPRTYAREPFGHAVLTASEVDATLGPGRCRAASGAWPAWDWPGWSASYDSPDERGKKACHDWRAMPAPCRELLAAMALLPAGAWLGLGGPLVPDLSLWGAGMHATAAGGFLGVHRDHETHPLTGLARRATAVLFLSEPWEFSWGGWLELWPPDRSRPAARVTPAMGALAVLENPDDGGYHGVAEVRCPAGVQRKSLVVCFYGPPRGEGGLTRARFVAAGAELQDPDLGREEWRRRRAGLPGRA